MKTIIQSQPKRRSPAAKTLGLCAATLFAAAGAQAALVGQWDFDKGDLSATVGQDLTYVDWGGDTAGQTEFGTTTDFGLPLIDGQEAKVMKFPACLEGMGYAMPTPLDPNGGGMMVNEWTLIMDILYPPESDGLWRALIDIDEGLFAADAEFFINPSGGLGVAGQYDGSIPPNTWHRIAIVVDLANNLQIRKYIDGVEVGAQMADELDGRWALEPGYQAVLFTDNDGDTAVGYVNSIQLHDTALSKEQIALLGGPTAEGLPTVLPAVPAAIQEWTPARDYALADTDIGAVVALHDATVNDASVQLKLDGAPVEGAVITRDAEAGTLTVMKAAPGPFTPGTKHTLELVFDETLNGETQSRSFTHTFRIALWAEDFDELPLQPSEDESYGDNYFTRTPPPGWEIDDSGMPGYGDPDYADLNGVNEFAGWSFLNFEGWVQTAEDQRRSEFTKAHGAVAVADGDEWDDMEHKQGLFNSFLITAPIDVSGQSGVLVLRFDSAWRPEAHDDGPPAFPEGNINNQTGTIEVSWDGGEYTEILHWDSDPNSPTFKDHTLNETVTLPIDIPEGASSLRIKFGYTQAANDWFWAIDNLALLSGEVPPFIEQKPAPLTVPEGGTAELSVQVKGDEPLVYQWYRQGAEGDEPVEGAAGPTLTIPNVTLDDAGYYKVVISNNAGEAESDYVKLTVVIGLNAVVALEENFDELPLGDSVDERQDGTGTEGEPYHNVWTKQPPAGWTIDDSGVYGFDQPGVGVTDWKGWVFATVEFWNAAAGQGRDAFAKGTGAVAIADGDEWDDLGNPSGGGTMNTLLITPPIDLSGIHPDTLKLQFDSSWNPWADQKGVVTVAYDGGDPIEVLRFDSSVPAALNDTVVVPLHNPEGASTAVITFAYLDAGNDWWWAIDNIKVAGASSATGATLTIDMEGGEVIIQWDTDGVLQTAPTVAGPWSDIEGAQSPYKVQPTEDAAFFRVKN